QKKGIAAIGRDLQAAVDAVRGGVRRAHIIPRRLEGGLLRELFTRDGVGTLVSAERFEGMREARVADVPSILELIEPLAEAGQLVRRPKEMLEEHVDRFTVVERDGMIVACVAVYLYRPQRTAEIACVAVHPRHRSTGRA